MNSISKQQTFETMIQTALDSRLHAMSRRNLFRTAAIAGGSVAAIGTIGFAAAQDSTPSDQMSGDAVPFETAVDVLNYALTLEHLEAAFYRDGLAEFGVDAFTSWGYDASVYDKLSAIAAHEADHVTTLTSVITDLGGEPVAESTYDFGYTDAQEFLMVAQALEDTGVSAYQGAAQYAAADDGLLTAALTIHGVEARHAAYIAVLNGGNPFPEAFNPTLTPDEVLTIATPFIVG
jgi:bacterioferritin (cytochrome b1)